MLRTLIAGTVMFGASTLSNAETPAAASEPMANGDGICLFTGTPPADYSYVAVKELKYRKGSYGSVNDLLPRVVQDAKAAGADAIIHYNGAPRFGFWPWRFVSPVITGTAVKWSPARSIDCAGAGGHYTTGTLSAAPPPARK